MQSSRSQTTTNPGTLPLLPIKCFRSSRRTISQNFHVDQTAIRARGIDTTLPENLEKKLLNTEGITGVDFIFEQTCLTESNSARVREIPQIEK